MPLIRITAVVPQEKGRIKLSFENGTELLLYRSELRGLPRNLWPSGGIFREGDDISDELYHTLLYGIVGKRAKKRAMFLLERMERTEKQLTEKLKMGGYPEACIDEAVDYVRQYRYLDDARYAEHYIRCRQHKKSREHIKTELLGKGVARELIADAMEKVYEADEILLIRELLEKKHYDAATSDVKEKRRIYAFLMRKGFQSGDVMRVMGENKISNCDVSSPY